MAQAGAHRSSVMRGTNPPSVLLLLLITLLFASAPRVAAAAERQPFPIAYLGLEDDPRHAAVETYARLMLRPAIDPLDGAKVAMRDARIAGRATGLDFRLEVARVRDHAELPAAFDRLFEQGVRFFLVDLEAGLLRELAQHAADREALLFNVSAPDDALRGELCARNVLHVIPSQSMLTDALAQFLAHKQWRRVLLLHGPLPEDAELAALYSASLNKFGVRVVETRDFVAGNDPRAREKNDIQLLTTGVDYDVVLVVDTVGEFARYIPYNTVLPRPVVGSTGLVASAWHWASERFGSPQLNNRFEREVNHLRHMQDAEFAAWASVRALIEAVMRARSSEFAAIRDALLAEDVRLDVYKGVPASFRSWDHQMRQPVVLHTHDAVAAYAPLPEFLHARNHLDTLGVDEPMSACRF
jgi:ABC transporter substrate binding protein (PQQ-dependent alcohol dehydrogenase system)